MAAGKENRKERAEDTLPLDPRNIFEVADILL